MAKQRMFGGAEEGDGDGAPNPEAGNEAPPAEEPAAPVVAADQEDGVVTAEDGAAAEEAPAGDGAGEDGAGEDGAGAGARAAPDEAAPDEAAAAEEPAPEDAPAAGAGAGVEAKQNK